MGQLPLPAGGAVRCAFVVREGNQAGRLDSKRTLVVKSAFNLITT